jgi:hypothetical protein
VRRRGRGRVDVVVGDSGAGVGGREWHALSTGDKGLSECWVVKKDEELRVEEEGREGEKKKKRRKGKEDGRPANAPPSWIL